MNVGPMLGIARISIAAVALACALKWGPAIADGKVVASRGWFDADDYARQAGA